MLTLHTYLKTYVLDNPQYHSYPYPIQLQEHQVKPPYHALTQQVAQNNSSALLEDFEY